MLGTPEGARKRSIDSLVNNMLAEDAYRHDHEAAPPIDPEFQVFGGEKEDLLFNNPSVMDTAFLSPEERETLGRQTQEENRWRELEANNQGLVRDYPEDWVAGGFGLLQLGKGLSKWGLKSLAKQQAPKQLSSPKKPVFTDLKQAVTVAKQNKPDKFKQAMKHKQGQLNAKLAKAQKEAYGGKVNDPLHGPPDPIMDDLEWASYGEGILDYIPYPRPRYTTFGGQGSNVPIPKWMSAPTKTMRIPPASLNSIPAAAVLHESMTE